MTDLGTTLRVAGFAVEGKLTSFDAGVLLKSLVHLIGMTPYGKPVIRAFPTIDGKGGDGETIVQPFCLQPLVESFIFSLPGAIAYDSYKLSDCTGFYLLIASCKDFDIITVEDYIIGFGLKIIDIDSMSLELGHGRTNRSGCDNHNSNLGGWRGYLKRIWGRLLVFTWCLCSQRIG